MQKLVVLVIHWRRFSEWKDCFQGYDPLEILCKNCQNFTEKLLLLDSISHQLGYKTTFRFITPQAKWPPFLSSLLVVSQRRLWHPTPVLLPGKSYGQRSLAGCSPWGREEADTTEQLHFPPSCIGEGNGNPLQCSCLENPREGGAWWAAVYGVAQSRTRLKRLSSSFVSLSFYALCSLLWRLNASFQAFFFFPVYHVSVCFLEKLRKLKKFFSLTSRILAYTE